MIFILIVPWSNILGILGQLKYIVKIKPEIIFKTWIVTSRA